MSDLQKGSKLDKFKEIIDFFRGKTDIRTRLKEMLDPDNPLTSTVLKEQELQFVSDSVWLGNAYPKVFGPLKQKAITHAFTTVSRGGIGREHAIQLLKVADKGGSMYFQLAPQEPTKESKEKGKTT